MLHAECSYPYAQKSEEIWLSLAFPILDKMYALNLAEEH